MFSFVKQGRVRQPARTTQGKLIFRSEKDVFRWAVRQLFTEESTDALVRALRQWVSFPWWLGWAKGTVFAVLDRALPGAVLSWIDGVVQERGSDGVAQ